jgi:hypothetical protein
MKPALRFAYAALVFGLVLGITGRAEALPITTFQLAWSGASLGNGATATAIMEIDEALLPNPGAPGFMLTPAFITSVTLTVSGASAGNGTFTLADFVALRWDTEGGTLDLNTELVGQATAGQPWGTTFDTLAGDFNLFGDGVSPAPVGTTYFTLSANGGAGDPMRLISFRPVPEPVSAGLECHRGARSGVEAADTDAHLVGSRARRLIALQS